MKKKVRIYKAQDGGETMEMDQSNPAMQMQPPKRQPATIDASAKQLMTFLLDQLSKGTSERILRKTLIDTGLKSEQADELLQVAKQEFQKIIEQGDNSTSAEEEEINMMANNQGMTQPNPAMMGQQPDQMEAQYGGSMKKIRRMNMGGMPCPQGYEFSDITGKCMPSTVTANVINAGSQAVNIAGSNAQNPMFNTNAANDNAISKASSENARRNAEMDYYDNLLNTGNSNRNTKFDNRMAAMGTLHQQMMENKMPWQQNNITPDARFGGLAKFVGGGQSCPEGQYWNGTACVDVFQKDPRVSVPSAPMNAPQSNNVDAVLGDQSALVKGIDASSSPIFGNDPNAPLGPSSINTFDPNAKTNSTNKTDVPIDPRLTNSPYIVRTDKNKLANLDDNWVNRALAVGSNIGSAQALGYAGAFGPYLQAIMGLTGAASSAALGVKKFFAGDKRTTYDDKGNVFVYDNKRSFKNAGRNIDFGATNTGRNDDIPRDMFVKTSDDQFKEPMGVGNKGELVSFDNPMRNAPITEGSKTKYSDRQRLDDMLEMTGQTRQDFRKQGPAIFGSNKYGTQEDLKQDYADANMFEKMRIRNQFKRDAAWDPDLSDSDVLKSITPKVNVEQKQEGGEWNPFVDNRRKLRITLPMYNLGGGPVSNETFPFQQHEWAQATGKSLPLSAEDVAAYNEYLQNFNTNTAQNMTDNTNNALSRNPNANMVDTKELTIERGNPLEARVAQNSYSGLAGWNAGKAELEGRKRMNQLGMKRQQIGNSMFIAPLNLDNQFGSWMTNATQGSDYQPGQQGARQYSETTYGKFGGTKEYKKGGTYNISKEELDMIIAMGGEVEFLN